MDMRIAKDGKKFDVDILNELENDEVEIIQFLRPDAKRRRMSTKLTVELVEKSKDMILSTEDLGTGKIAIYGRKVGEPVEKDYLLLADNCAGNNSPNNVLTKVINKVFDRK